MRGLLQRQLAQSKTVLIFRPLEFAPLLWAVPALRALRLFFPKSRIILIGNESSRPFCARFPKLLDELIEFPGYPGLLPNADVRAFPRFLIQVQRRQVDLVLQLAGGGEGANAAASLLGARFVAGFFTRGGWCPDPELFIPYPTNEPEWRRPLRLLQHLEIPIAGEDLEYPLTPDDLARTRSLLEANGGAPKRYLLMDLCGEQEPPCEAVFLAQAADYAAQSGMPILWTNADHQFVQRAVGLMRGKKQSLPSMSHDLLAVMLRGSSGVITDSPSSAALCEALKVRGVLIRGPQAAADTATEAQANYCRSLSRLQGVTAADLIGMIEEWQRRPPSQAPEKGSANTHAPWGRGSLHAG